MPSGALPQVDGYHWKDTLPARTSDQCQEADIAQRGTVDRFEPNLPTRNGALNDCFPFE